MTHIFLAATAGPLTLNGTFIVETVAFLLMLLFLSYVPLPFLGIPKPVFPWIISIAEARQRDITAKLAEAEKARSDAQEQLTAASAKLQDANRTAQTVIDAAGKSAEQLRLEIRGKADEEARRIADSARREIEAEREKALQSVRSEVAGLVVEATEKIIGETLDVTKHKELIDRAIAEVASGDGSR